MPRVSYVKAADLFLIVSFAFTFMALLESVIVYNYKRKSLKAENGQVKNLTGGRSFFRKRGVGVDEVWRNIQLFEMFKHFTPNSAKFKICKKNWIQFCKFAQLVITAQ